MMWEVGVGAQVTYYVFDTRTASTVVREESANWIADDRYGSVAYDPNNDGYKDIITVTPANTLKCMKTDGTTLWSRTFGAYDQLGCPALYDLDGDGKYEVVLGRYSYSGTDKLLVINAEDGTTNMSVNIGGKPMAAPVIGDVDSDGHPEMVVVGQTNKKVYCVNETGGVEWQATLPSGAWSSPIMGDFDADGLVEVVVVTSDGRVCYLSGDDGTSKKVVATGLNVKASPVAADLNGDGYLEIIVAGLGTAVDAIDWRGNVHTWTNNPGWQLTATPAIADIDADGVPEVIVCDDQLRVFKWSGLYYHRSVGSGWKNTGQAPLVFDSDGDGLNDIVFFMTATTQTGLFKSTTTTSSSQRGWPTFKNDFRRSGVYGSDTYGLDPDLIISNHNWSYGNITKGSIQYKDFKITNVGPVPLTGTCVGQGKISINDTSPFTLTQGSSKGFRATFDTSEQGIQTGFIVITTNDPDEPKLNITATANITQPEHDIAVEAIHVADELNPNYVNVPPLKVEYRNLGSFVEYNISANLTVNNVLCPNLSRATFDLLPGESVNVTFLWNRSIPSISGQGTFTLRAAVQNANFSLEADTANNVKTKTVEVSYPILVESVSSWLRVNMTNLTYYSASNNFTEGDVMNLRIVLSNQWSTPITLIPVVNVEDATGAPVQAYSYIGYQLVLPPGDEVTIWPGWYLGLEIDSPTMYDATVYAFDSLGGGVKVLADPFVHTFWVEPAP